MKWVVLSLFVCPPPLESENSSERHHYGIEVVECRVGELPYQAQRYLDHHKEESENADPQPP